MHAELFSKNHCPYCVRAKHLLEQRGVSYTVIDAVEHRDLLIERVEKDSGAKPRTVPQIYIDDQYIGGFNELVAHFKNEDLRIDDAAAGA